MMGAWPAGMPPRWWLAGRGVGNVTAQTKDNARGTKIAQVGREIAEACLEQGGWLEASQERFWEPDGWEWTTQDYDYAREVLGSMTLEEVQAVRAAVVAHLQEAVDAAQARKKYRVQVAVRGGGCDAIVAGLAEALRVAALCGAPWWYERDYGRYFLYASEDDLDADDGSKGLEVGVVEAVAK